MKCFKMKNAVALEKMRILSQNFNRMDKYICTRDVFNGAALASIMASIWPLNQKQLLEMVSLDTWTNTALIQVLSSSLILLVVLFVSLSNAPHS